jgi:hypothetical protein
MDIGGTGGGFVSPMNAAVTAGASGKFSVIADKVNVRAAPDEKNGEVVAQVNSSDRVEILEKTLDSYTIKDQAAPWYRIKDPSGWVFGAFLKPTS